MTHTDVTKFQDHYLCKIIFSMFMQHKFDLWHYTTSQSADKYLCG